MADTTYQPKVYKKNNGDQQVVASGGSILMETGSKILPNSGTQAVNIVALTDSTTGTPSDTLASISDTATKNAVASLAAKVNSLIAAIQGAGITAAS